MTTSTPISIRVGEQVIAGRLDGTPTATELLELLPLELLLEDFQGPEKLAHLPHRLTTRDAPKAAGADPGDIGYYSPSHHLVLHYAPVAAFPGIILVGRFDDSALDLMRELEDRTSASVAGS